MPLYVDNDTANRLLAEAGRKPYATKEEWQLVQTHLVEPDGTFHELWRPGPFTGKRDPEDLAAALDRAIRRLGLEEKPPLEAPGTPPTLLLEAVLRLPLREGDLGRPDYVVDKFAPQDATALLPPTDEPYEVPPQAARRLLVHLRPPLDRARDPEPEALARVREARLQGTPAGNGWVALEGALRMEAPNPTRHAGAWTEILRTEATVRGYLRYDPATRELRDLQLVTEQASFEPPDGSARPFRGMIHRRQTR